MWVDAPIAQHVNSTLSIYLARVELVKLSEMLEKAYIPRRSEFGGFSYIGT